MKLLLGMLVIAAVVSLTLALPSYGNMDGWIGDATKEEARPDDNYPDDNIGHNSPVNTQEVNTEDHST